VPDTGSFGPETLTPAGVRAAAHALVGELNVDDDTIILPDATHRHFAKVLRLRVGEVVTVTNGAGAWRTTVVPASFSEAGCLIPTSEVQEVSRSYAHVSIGIALPKGDKPEFTVQKLTEIGVDAVVLFPGDHSVARWDDDKAAKNLIRLRAVAVEAMQQSRGVYLPEIAWVPQLKNWVADRSANSTVFRADAGGAAPRLEARQIVLIGPEGGWSESERSVGIATSLASNVLRTETAAVAAATLWCALRSHYVRPWNRLES
jgi:16S rRNA (uracil1498-N3)-methyltransferase